MQNLFLFQNRTIIVYKRNRDVLKSLIIIKKNNTMKTVHQQLKQQKQQVRLQQKTRIACLEHFLTKNQPELIKNVTLDNTKATVVPDTPEYLDLLGQMIRNGQLVGFPTETVYGLGADATNQNALLEIYRVKRRPLTDPIIVHVLNLAEALKLVEPQSEKQLELFSKLTNQYWPGPLTVILKANLAVLPSVVTAQTGFVGIRSPKSKYARQLIQKSQRPIGAPSANLFSHVSPTSAVHVLNDFYDQQVAIVDGQKCQYGVESTVVKIIDGNLEILREGSLSTKKLSEFVQKQFGKNVNIAVKKRIQKQDEGKNMEAPGQLLKHYAPYLPCYSADLNDLKQSKQNSIQDLTRDCEVKLSQAALIVFDSAFDCLQKQFKFYLSSNSLDEQEIQEEQLDEDEKFCTLQEKKKMRSLYHFLRKAENLDVRVILIGWNEPKQGTLWDKIFRATQGHQAQVL